MMRYLAILLALASLIAWGSHPTSASQSEGSTSSESDASGAPATPTNGAKNDSNMRSEAVDSALGDSMWYDSDAGAIIPVKVESEIDDSDNRDSRWLPKAKRVRQSNANTTTNTGTGGTGGGGGGAGLFGSGLSIGNVFGWVLLITLVALGIGLIIYAVSKTEMDSKPTSRGRGKKQSQSPDEQMIERMKHLPAELRRTDVNLRSEAERLMREGQYDQAIILLFGHQLLLLDRTGMLRLNRGKTNRKYVRETRSADPKSAKRLQRTVTAFERSYFGRHTIDQREFSDLWRQNEQLEADIERQREVAA
jgi:hypothetical protein